MEYDEDDPARDQRVVHGDEDEEDIPLEDDEDDDEDGEAPKGTKMRGGKHNKQKAGKARGGTNTTAFDKGYYTPENGSSKTCDLDTVLGQAQMALVNLAKRGSGADGRGECTMSVEQKLALIAAEQKLAETKLLTLQLTQAMNNK